jgi:acylphosphatase
MIVARRYVIAGHVQGVGFRMFAADGAAREGIHGYAQNLPDGRVEVWAEGDESSVDRFERALRRGPGGARIDSVEVAAVDPRHRATGFATR